MHEARECVGAYLANRFLGVRSLLLIAGEAVGDIYAEPSAQLSSLINGFVLPRPRYPHDEHHRYAPKQRQRNAPSPFHALMLSQTERFGIQKRQNYLPLRLCFFFFFVIRCRPLKTDY